MSIESRRVISDQAQAHGQRHVQAGFTDHLGTEHVINRVVSESAVLRDIMPVWEATVLENLEAAETAKVVGVIERGGELPTLKHITTAQVRTEYTRRKAEIDTDSADLATRKSNIEAAEA